MKKNLLVLGLLVWASVVCSGQVVLEKISTYYTDVFDEGSVEIVAHDPVTQNVYFVNSDNNTVGVVNIANPKNPVLITEISHEAYGAGVNSIAVKNDVVAVAVEAANPTDNGRVVFWTTSGEYITDVEVGALPDMLVFTNDGSRVIVANEGEPNDDYTVDPEGSISIVELDQDLRSSVDHIDFNALGDAASLRQLGIRIFGPGASVAQDLEPEYIVVNEDDTRAYVVCQENNAIIEIDLENNLALRIWPLGYKDHSLAGNGLDASNRDDTINIQNYPILGMFQPDAISYYKVNGQDFILTANEGDSRDYDGFSEEIRVKDLVLDPTSYPNAGTLQLEENLGRLLTTTTLGDDDSDGDVDQIYSYGGRSFSIFNATTGQLVWDSGDQFEQYIAANYPENFNAQNDENDFDSRSDDKGPEPEAITVAEIDGRWIAFIGLERIGGIMVYDVSDPNAPEFLSYYNNRDFTADPESREVGDLGIEDIKFIPAAQSPTRQDILITGNEVSGTMTIFAVNPRTKDIIFDEAIDVTNFEPVQFLVPPSPLSTQVVFVGGHDIVQTTQTYGNPAGQAIAKEWHDFIGFTPDDSGESLGWVTVNHESIYRDDRIGDGGGMTAFRVAKNANGSLDVVDQELTDGRQGKFFNVDFVNTVGETGMNCGGIVGPNGRIWTAEEWFRTSTSSIWNSSARTSSLPIRVQGLSDGWGVRDTAEFTINAPEFPEVHDKTIQKYQNFNYMTEVDPKEAKAIRKQYNWGRAGWEGGAISNDGKYVYLGIDGVPAPWVRFTADEAFDFTEGTLEVYKHNNPVGQRWIEVPMNEENIFGGLTEYAWSVGATMYMRNEWVTIDRKTGRVYWTETGRDSGSSGPGLVYNSLTSMTNAVTAPHHEALARQRGHRSATDPAYQDYYGRVLYYDPATEEVGVTVEGGPYYSTSPDVADYPSVHLSNPDGLSIMEIDGQNFLLIQEDLNGSSFGRTPEGISNRLCELFLLDARIEHATVDDLVRVTAIPRGAEVTGAIQIDANTILVNSQHPNPNNPFPYNHSLTMAIHGFEGITLQGLQNGENEEGIRINSISRIAQMPSKQDYAVYNSSGKRISVYRNVDEFSIDGLGEGSYYVLDAEGNNYELVIQ